MKNNVLLQRGIKIVCLILVVLILVNVSMPLVINYDHNSTVLEGFYLEPKNSLDIVLIGASDIRAGFSSAYAYETFGFTSYPYAVDGVSALMLESQIREVLNRQNPSWIIIEVNGFLQGDDRLHLEEVRVRRYLDNIPFSWNRISTILKNIPHKEQINYLFPLSKYHSNWKNLCEQITKFRDIIAIRNNGHSRLKGNVTTISQSNIGELGDIKNNYSTIPLSTQSELLLVSFLEYCKENNINNVLFVRCPHVIESESEFRKFKRCNEVERIVKEYGFDFLNLERDYEPIGLDFSEDFYNNDHAYLSGQRKITEYICKMLVEKYGMTPRIQSEENRQNWETSVQYYELFYEYCEEIKRNGKRGVYYETQDLIKHLTEMGRKRGYW